MEDTLVEVQAQLVSAQGQVSALTARVEGLQTQVTHLQRVAENRAEDLRIIGRRLAQEADDREWCEEYERIVEQLFNEMSTDGDRIFLDAAKREREMRVEVTVTFTVDVTARNEEDAAEKIGEDLFDYIDRYGTWDVTNVREQYRY